MTADYRPDYEDCPECRGTGEGYRAGSCTGCGGTGEDRRRPVHDVEALKARAIADLDAVVEQCRAEHEAGVEAIADRIERRMGGVA